MTLLWTKCFLLHIQSLIYMGCCTECGCSDRGQGSCDQIKIRFSADEEAGKPKMAGMLPGDFPSKLSILVSGHNGQLLTTRDRSVCGRDIEKG